MTRSSRHSSLLARASLRSLPLWLLPGLVACAQEVSAPRAEEASPGTSAPASTGVLARVNGVAITSHDVSHWLARNSRGEPPQPTPEQTRNVLEAVIDQELIRQQAEVLGLDQDEGYREQIAAKQAELDALRRAAIRDRYYQRLTHEAAEVTEQEVRRFFDQHATQIRTRYHVQQILMKTEQRIARVRQQLDQGAAFEELAAERFKGLDESVGKPWDLGWLGWAQVPEPWREVLERLQVGEVSDVIRGPGHRFWIVKLVERAQDPEVTFDRVRAALTTVLKRDRAAALRRDADQRLREGAVISYTEATE